MKILSIYLSKVGMMHESKGQHIGKAPSLHLFHTTVRQCMLHACNLLHNLSSELE